MSFFKRLRNVVTNVLALVTIPLWIIPVLLLDSIKEKKILSFFIYGRESIFWD